MASNRQIPWPSPGNSRGHHRAGFMTAHGQFLLALDRPRRRSARTSGRPRVVRHRGRPRIPPSGRAVAAVAWRIGWLGTNLRTGPRPREGDADPVCTVPLNPRTVQPLNQVPWRARSPHGSLATRPTGWTAGRPGARSAQMSYRGSSWRSSVVKRWRVAGNPEVPGRHADERLAGSRQRATPSHFSWRPCRPMLMGATSSDGLTLRCAGSGKVS